MKRLLAALAGYLLSLLLLPVLVVWIAHEIAVLPRRGEAAEIVKRRMR